MAVLHTEFANQVVDENKIPVIDRKIYSYIERYGDIPYDKVIAGEPEWQVFYQLSELRTGIVSWYDFKPDASVLEIGGGFGTLTGCLCRKCSHVTVTERSLYRAQAMAKRYEGTGHLDIYAGEATEIVFPELFDYICVIGLLERMGGGSTDKKPYADYLQFWLKRLKPDGKILFAVENRFGLRYFCGAAEPHTGRAFDGINHYRQGTSGYSFSRKEIEEIVRKAGFAHYKFYYPLPDYKLPQLVYTDEYLPERNLKERLLPYYRRSDTLVAAEEDLYDDIISNGVFPFFANSFFLECRTQGQPGRVSYAAVSTDRGEARSFATTIGVDGKVCKEPLYQEGRVWARKLYENTADLKNHGIPVVEHTLLPGDVLELPFISWPTLSNYIKEIMGTDQERFLKIIDQIYAYILQSSEQAPEEENALLQRGGLSPEGGTGEAGGKDIPAGEAGASGKSPLHFGPILKKAYMELIPLNCFYDNASDSFLYFDQEFVRENYPARYVLFRAIHYIYCFTPNAERYYPRQKLIEKYEMEDTWEIYMREEMRFLDEVRNREQYSQFYRWTRVDRGRILENARRLEAGQ